MNEILKDEIFKNGVFNKEISVSMPLLFGGIVIISIILFIVLGKLSNTKNISDDIIAGLKFGIVASAFIICILYLATMTQKTEEKNINSKEEKLISMRFDNKISGEFLLGAGSINNTDYVVYYTKNGNEIVRNKKEASDVKIIEDKTDHKVVTISREKTITTKTIFGEKIVKYSEEPITELHIPAKSIITNIQLN